MHGESRRRPVDPYGLTLSTSAGAAERYNAALGRLLRLQDGVEDGLADGRRRGRGLRPGARRPRAPRATSGAPTTTGTPRSAPPTAPPPSATSTTARARFLDAVTTRLRTDEATGAAALLRHVRLFPRDALAVSVAVPTVAFGGLTSGSQTAELVESLGRSYGDDWWYAGQLAFVRQDQERWAEAEELSSYALSVEPASGHAVHARAHVFYETGDHTAGLAWLDEWIRTRGPEANHRSHFSWHAALHELMQDDVEAVRRRYARELAPSVVSGSRVVVDSGALLWRGRVTGAWTDDLPVAEVRAQAPAEWLTAPADAVRRHAQRRPARRRRRRRRADPPRRAGRHAARTASSATSSRPCAPAWSPVVEERWNAAVGDAAPGRRHDGPARRQQGAARGRRGHARARAGDGRSRRRGRRRARRAALPPLVRPRRPTSGGRHGAAAHADSQAVTRVLQDALSSVAVTTMFALAIVELHVELSPGRRRGSRPGGCCAEPASRSAGQGCTAFRSIGAAGVRATTAAASHVPPEREAERPADHSRCSP